MIMNLLIWAVVAYGMTTILVYGTIFNGLRNWIHKNAQPGNGLFLLTPVFSFVSSLIKCMFSEWDGNPINFIFFPKMPEKITIFDSLNVK